MNAEYGRGEGGPYRSRNGVVFGVCRGLAEHLGVSVTGLRVLGVILLFMSVGWAVFGYCLLAIVMKPEPVMSPGTGHQKEFYNSYASSGVLALERLSSTLDRLDRRIQRLEKVVTGRDYDWRRRLDG